jgi:energy-converting hydrogenase Eha subunit A
MSRKLPLMSSGTPHRSSALLSFRFLTTAIAGSVLMALVSAFGPLPAQLAVLGGFISILGGLFLSYLGQEEQREKDRTAAIESLSVPLSLAGDPELFDRYRQIAGSLSALAQRTDPILRRIALLKLASVAEQIDGLGSGKIVFALTEGWRTVYEEILRSPDLREYRSVSWVRSPKYWQDEPGAQSMRVNFEAVERRVLVERIVILRDDLWPAGEALPSPKILPWIKEQHNHGLWIALVRESELSRESELLIDMGIYGDRAVGTQELDDACRTLRFTLDLDPETVQLADSKWQRLLLYARSFASILDQQPRQG